MKCQGLFSKNKYIYKSVFFYDRINTIYQFIKPFLGNKMSIFEEYRAFKEKNPRIIIQYASVLNIYIKVSSASVVIGTLRCPDILG